MSTFINETTVMQFYIDCIDRDEIVFLKDRPMMKDKIKKNISELLNAETMNAKIQIAVVLWKNLFEASMSFISPDKRGYDKLFKYFDAYVEFEELIFASDSFYRDHTLHCIWVYFLGEYIARKKEFSPLFTDMRRMEVTVDGIDALGVDHERATTVKKTYKEYLVLNEASRCVSALTHDLGYPLKKIGKINKSISKVLPFFAVNEYTDFSFNFGNIQAEYINSFIDFISRSFAVNFAIKEDVRQLPDYAKRVERISALVAKAYLLEKGPNGNDISSGPDYEAIAAFSEEERKLLRESMEISTYFMLKTADKNGYLNDFENYQHGIMSAFLLVKNLSVFQSIEFDAKRDKIIFSQETTHEAAVIWTLQNILAGISAHTSETKQINELEDSNYLTFIDELEEFSRISRASQNREYVKEFCESAIDFTEDGWLDIRFVFKNANLDNLDPEISFKGRCKRFLSLFNVPELSENLKIRVSCIGELPNNKNIYELEIAKKHADIRINGVSQDIPKYLKSAQYFTKEEYENM